MKLLCVIRLRYKDQLWSSLTHTHIHIHILKTHTNIYRKNLLTHMHLKYKHTHTHTQNHLLLPTHPPPFSLLPEYVCMYVGFLPSHTHFSAQPTYPPLLPFPYTGGEVGSSVISPLVCYVCYSVRPTPPPFPSPLRSLARLICIMGPGGVYNIYGCVCVCVFI